MSVVLPIKFDSVRLLFDANGCSSVVVVVDVVVVVVLSLKRENWRIGVRASCFLNKTFTISTVIPQWKCYDNQETVLKFANVQKLMTFKECV